MAPNGLESSPSFVRTDDSRIKSFPCFPLDCCASDRASRAGPDKTDADGDKEIQISDDTAAAAITAAIAVVTDEEASGNGTDSNDRDTDSTDDSGSGNGPFTYHHHHQLSKDEEEYDAASYADAFADQFGEIDRARVALREKASANLAVPAHPMSPAIAASQFVFGSTDPHFNPYAPDPHFNQYFNQYTTPWKSSNYGFSTSHDGFPRPVNMSSGMESQPQHNSAVQPPSFHGDFVPYKAKRCRTFGDIAAKNNSKDVAPTAFSDNHSSSEKSAIKHKASASGSKKAETVKLTE